MTQIASIDHDHHHDSNSSDHRHHKQPAIHQSPPHTLTVCHVSSERRLHVRGGQNLHSIGMLGQNLRGCGNGGEDSVTKLFRARRFSKRRWIQ